LLFEFITFKVGEVVYSMACHFSKVQGEYHGDKKINHGTGGKHGSKKKGLISVCSVYSVVKKYLITDGGMRLSRGVPFPWFKFYLIRLLIIVFPPVA
jgi:hypothetical protein